MAGRRQGGGAAFTRAAGAVPAACGRSQLKRRPSSLPLENTIYSFSISEVWWGFLVDSWKMGSGRIYIYVYLEPFRTEIWQRRETGCVLQPRQKWWWRSVTDWWPGDPAGAQLSAPLRAVLQPRVSEPKEHGGKQIPNSTVEEASVLKPCLFPLQTPHINLPLPGSQAAQNWLHGTELQRPEIHSTPLYFYISVITKLAWHINDPLIEIWTTPTPIFMV